MRIKLSEFLKRAEENGLNLKGCGIQGTTTLFYFSEVREGKVWVSYSIGGSAKDYLVSGMQVSHFSTPKFDKIRLINRSPGLVIHANNRG